MTAPNAAQLAAILATDRHLLVAAGAGTGKTTTVVGRILYLLGAKMEGQRHQAPVSLDRIAAITYTNAAAADLQQKLRDRLRLVGLRDVAYQVDNARIGTIHGFCADLLRESALRAGRSPGFDVLEEGAGGALLAEAARDALVTSVGEGGVAGLEELLSGYRQREVEGFVRRLAADGDRLARMEQAADLPASEGALVALALRARRLLEARLDARGAVDFDRMITWTRDLLRDDLALRRRLQRRLHTLIVDEFQDVDPVQREIAWLLGEPDTRAPSTTRLMLVGDPKQSIYRFRRADVTVWRSVEEAFRGAGLGDVVELEENYRSVAPILALVDAAVGPVLDAPVVGHVLQPFEVGYRPVTAATTEKPADRAVEVLLVPPDEKGKLLKAEPRRIAEAAAMARRARELRDQGVALRDMASLFSAMGSVEVYQQALEREGIRTYLLRGEGFYERREILDLLLALRVMRNPRDHQAMVGFLRSPFVALPDEMLFGLSLEHGRLFWDNLRAPDPHQDERVSRAVALVESHLALRDRVPVHELLASLLERSGYLAHLALLGAPADQALANIRKFLRIARQQEGVSVGDFLRTIEELRAREEREGDERLHGQHDEVMTLTTVHSAKGLEWDTVFWCDLEREPPKPGGRDSTLLVGREAIALKDPDAESANDQPAAWQALLAADGAESAAERKRLWYVASTRARRRLILSGISAGEHEKGSPGEALAGGLDLTGGGDEFGYAGRDGRTYTGALRCAALREEPAEPVAPDPWTEPLPGTLPPQVEVVSAPTGPARHSATSLMMHRRCERRHGLRYVAGLREPEVRREGGEYLTAIAKGQVIHDVLEQLEEESDVAVLLDAAIGRWDDSAPPPDTEAGAELRAQLLEELQQVARSPDYQAVAANPTARRELPFLEVLGPDVRIEGKLDLAAREESGLVLLDVKTSPKGAEEVETVAGRYDLQRAVYVEAVERIGGTPVSRFSFQFSRAERQVSVTIGAREREEGRRLVEEALARIEAGGESLTAYAEECGWCGFKAAGWCPGAPGGG